jgi:hypothetical protein
MATGSFDDFVQREIDAASKSDGSSVNWERERTEWLRYLSNLYLTLNAFLKPYIDAGQISVYTGNTWEINEEHLGTYAVPQMSIVIGAKTVILEPMGTVQVGNRGRVDVTCGLARAMMILVESGTVAQLIPSSGLGKPEASGKSLATGRWVWKIVTRDTVDLTRDTFQSLLIQIARG